MKKRIIAGAAATLSTALSLGSCGLFGSTDNVDPTPLYGPPEYFESKESDKSGDQTVPPLYGPPEYSDNDNSDNNAAVSNDDDFDAELNKSVEVYGPPEWFENDVNKDDQG